MTRHMHAGYAAATLVVFRLIWGLVGPESARFSRLLRGGPRAPATTGPAPRAHGRAGVALLGALSALVLVMVLAQAGTGLFSNDDRFFDAPWARVLTKDTSDLVTGFHALIGPVLLGLIALYLGAAAWTRQSGRTPARPMPTGRAEAPPGTPAPRHRPLWLAALALAAAAALNGAAFRFW